MAGAAIAQCLAVNRKIRSLDLGDNCLQDAGCAMIVGAVAANPGIVSLNISNNQAGRATASTLANVFVRGGTLHTIIASHNNIGTFLIPRLLDSLPFCHALRVLDLSYNKVSSR